MAEKVLSPSNIALDLGQHSPLFGQPKAMGQVEISDLIERFVTTTS
jgi:2,4-dienoyl-CoA reductase-like NADH-dependent reductase (Old Yellow Enzyme family)